MYEHAVSESLSLICRLYESLGIWITSIAFAAISRFFSTHSSVLFEPLKNTLTLFIYFDGGESSTIYMEHNKAGSKRPLSFSMDHILAKNDSQSDRDRVSNLSHSDNGNSGADPPKIQKLSEGPSSSDDVLSQTFPSLGTESWRRSPKPRPSSPLSISTQIPIDSSSTSSSNSNSPTSTSQSLANNSQRASPESSIQDSITPSPPQAVKYSPGFLVKNGIKVELEGQDLWKKFHRLSTEMIITKAGRRMFPTLKIRVSGLAATQSYMIFLDLVPFDDKRYRYVYHSSQWMVAGAGDPQPCPSTFVHGDSPASGNMWESQGVISFDKLKLTNNRSSIVQGQICLHSMHKYIPRIHVQPLSADQIKSGSTMEALLDIDQSVSFTFPETVFTTVTAYQNQQITKLKIASNPFAKGFREATRTRDPGFSDFNSFYNHQMNMEILRLNNPHLAHDQYSPFLYSSPHTHHLAPIPGSPLFSPLWNMLPPFMPMLRRSESLTPSEASISPIHCHRMDDQ